MGVVSDSPLSISISSSSTSSMEALYLNAVAFCLLRFDTATLHSRGHLVKVISPVFQLILGLCFCNQVNPIITVDLPRSHTSKVAFSLCPLCDSIKEASWVIEPPWLSVPSTLYTRIGRSNCRIVIAFPSANFLSINILVAPLSSKALTSTILCVSRVLRPTLTINSAFGLTVRIKYFFGLTRSRSLRRNFCTQQTVTK